MILDINEKHIELKHGFRSLMIYENITGKSFNPVNLTDIVTYFYCVVLASEKTVRITFDEFINLIDEKPDKVTEFADWLTKTMFINQNIKEDSDSEDEDGEKKTS